MDEENRWLRIKKMMPWGELEVVYGTYFSQKGRPGLDGRLVVGLFLLKHLTVKSEGELILELQENVCWQAFCGIEGFVKSKQLNSSSLTKIRKRLGPKFTKELEEKTYRVLIEKKIVRAKGMLVDATVAPENIKYPNDIGLLNDVRKWVVYRVSKVLQHITQEKRGIIPRYPWKFNVAKLMKRGIERLKEVSDKTGEKTRTCRRKAKRLCLNFAKRGQKTKKMIEQTKKQMLQYVRRNLEPVKERAHHFDYLVQEEIREKIELAGKIYEQQYTMHKEKTNKIDGRIVG